MNRRPGELPLALILAVLLLASCAPEDSDIAAERELARYQPPIGDPYVPPSAEHVVRTSTYVLIGTVAAIGPAFNSRRLGERGELGPDRAEFSIGRIYEVKVERYLKGSGPNPIRVALHEGTLPGEMEPTEARIKAARKKFGYNQLEVGSRYLCLTAFVQHLPELGNLDYYPLGGSPGCFLLRDGMATAVNAAHRTDITAGGVLFPNDTEEGLVKRMERLIADTTK